MEVWSELASLGAGFVTGWFFERRTSKEARTHNEDLQRRIIALKTTMLNLSGNRILGPNPAESGDLTAEVTERAIATQSPEGRVDRGALIAHFVGRGFGRSDIEVAIDSLCGAGIAKEEGAWLRIG